MIKRLLPLAPLGALAAPFMAFAQSIDPGTQGADAFTLLAFIQDILRVAFPILVALAIILFVVQVVQWIRADGDDKSDKAKNVAQSLLALFVLLALWGIIAFVINLTGVNPAQTPNFWDIPSI